MANPPITIGPFTNVPAPGSPIASAWPQQITTYVVNRFLTQAAFDHAGGTTGAAGTFDIGTQALGVLGYAARITVVATYWWGFNGAGNVNGTPALSRLVGGSRAAPGQIAALGSAWGAATISDSWTVAAGQDAGFKTVIQLGVPGGTTYYKASGIYSIQREG